jgi:hypothetical protein
MNIKDIHMSTGAINIHIISRESINIYIDLYSLEGEQLEFISVTALIG